ncbi:MAG: BON domain-containing protein [Acidobacteria bacterium]|nr:BON domain-containing protein [Acidobacteriota bacterium]
MRLGKFGVFAIAALLAGTAELSGAAQSAVVRSDVRTRQLEYEIGAALLRLPYYDVFDSLAYEVAGKGLVRLSGQVRTGWLKNDAERAVKRVRGVDTVINDIEILPPSLGDDRIRLAVYRSLFADSSLYRYALGANPSIRIIVKNGRVTLEGLVNSPMDKTMAGFKAREVWGVFGVTNNLVVEKS